MCVYRNRGKCVDTSLELFSPLKGGRDTMEGKHGDLGIVLYFCRVCVVWEAGCFSLFVAAVVFYMVSAGQNVVHLGENPSLHLWHWHQPYNPNPNANRCTSTPTLDVSKFKSKSKSKSKSTQFFDSSRHTGSVRS